jgi:hypothetical protein
MPQVCDREGTESSQPCGNRKFPTARPDNTTIKPNFGQWHALLSRVAGDAILLPVGKISFAFVVVSLMMIAAPNAEASVVYSYTGNPFNTFVGPVFSGNDAVTGEFTIASALGDNFNGSVSPAQFSFSNGLFSITNFSLSSSVFDIQTSNTGAIIQWNIALSVGLQSAGASISTSNSGDHSNIISPTTFSSGSNSGDPGAWSSAATPLPAALPLFATGIGALALLRWRRKRKATAG